MIGFGSHPRPWTYSLHEDLNSWYATDAAKNVIPYLTTFKFDPVVQQIVEAVNAGPAGHGEVTIPVADLELLASALQVVANGGSRSVDVPDEELAAEIVRTARKYVGYATKSHGIVRRL